MTDFKTIGTGTSMAWTDRPMIRPMISGLEIRLRPICFRIAPVERFSPPIALWVAFSIRIVPAIIMTGKCIASKIDRATRPSSPTERPTSGRPIKILLAKDDEIPAITAMRISCLKTYFATTWPTAQVTATPLK
ncbi:hypothetical protein D3C80_1430680 [compost metagenome]